MSLPLVLASGSPRRRQLMEEAGYEFRVLPPGPDAECGACSGESPDQLVARLAQRKAADVAPRAGEAIVIACDTVAVCRGQILGKPRDRDDAERMLRLMRGREHLVLTGLCVWRTTDGQLTTCVEVTRLTMDELSDDQLEDYLDSGGWEGKAGAFGYQDRLGWVHIAEGSPSNVVGLPMERLAQELERLVESR